MTGRTPKTPRKTVKKTAKTPPKAVESAALDWISLADAAKRLERSPQGIGQVAMWPGAPVRREGGKVLVQWPQFSYWREAEMLRRAKSESTPATLDQARTRKALAEAELAEMAVAKSRGEFVAVSDYDKALGKVLDHLMARLRAFPVRLAHFGPDVEKAAEEEAERVVVELHGFDEDVAEEMAQDEPEPE